jgi:hydroxymethylbilane synthase
LLLDLRPDLRVVPMRGNIDTRLSKLDRGECEALVLAKAGLLRAGLHDPSRMLDLPVEQFVPAAGQGALAVQCRRDDTATIELLAPLDCLTTRLCVELERTVVRELHGDCHSAIGVHAKPLGSDLLVLAALDTTRGVIRARATVTSLEPTESSATRVAGMIRGG